MKEIFRTNHGNNRKQEEKMSDEEKMALWELTLPRYLKKDIEAFVEGIRNNSTLLDCLWGEVYGSINSAFYDNEISEEQAVYLRKKYLGLGGE